MLNSETEKLPHIQSRSMAEKMLESVSSGKATVNEARASSGLEPIAGGDALYQRYEAGNKRVLYFCNHRKNKECKKKFLLLQRNRRVLFYK